MITSISTNFSIRADKEYKRYQVKCSTGDTIPLGSNGKPKGNVVLTFYKTGTEGEMTAVSAASVNIRRNATDGRYSTFSGTGSSLDITTNLNSFIDQYGGLSSIEVTMLDSVGGAVLAVQSFGAVKDGTNGTNGTDGTDGTDGADGVSYAVSLSTGATVPCTSDAELKAETLTLQLLKDGAAVTFSPTVTILSAANDVLATYSMQQDTYSTHNITSLFTSTIKHGTVNPVAPQSISVTARVGGKTVAVQRFNVVYDSPTPFVRKETVWSSGLTFHNGDIILLGGKVDNGNVFSWRCPVSGNSNEIPSLDVTNNPSTTNWVQFSYFNMVATNLLLASYALIENLGVESVEIKGGNGSITMKDNSGNMLFEMRNGNVTCNTGTFNNVTVKGIIHSSLSYSSVKKLLGTSGSYVIDPSKEAFNTLLATTVGGSTLYVTLPDAAVYEGMEINVYHSVQTTMGLGSMIIKTVNNTQYIYYSASTALINGITVQTVSAVAMLNRSLKIIPNVMVKLLAVDGNWYVISGALTGE